MASQGPLSPSTTADDNAVGSVTWANHANIVSSNDNYATASAPGAAVTHYLKGTAFGFSIPVGSTIDGFIVEIEHKGTLGIDVVVSMVKAGSVVGDNKADIVNPWPASDTYATYGGAADLWGTTWTADQINAGDFGVVLSASVTGAGTISVDNIRITVHYTEAAFDPATFVQVFCPPPRVPATTVIAY